MSFEAKKEPTKMGQRTTDYGQAKDEDNNQDIEIQVDLAAQQDERKSSGAGKVIVSSAEHHQFAGVGGDLQTTNIVVSTRQGCDNCGNGCVCGKFESESVMELLYSERERVRFKNFSHEIRALMDVEQFVHQAELILDMTEVSVERIVDVMLERVISNEKASDSVLNEARDAIFVPGSSMLVARTIQGVSFMVEPNKGQIENGGQFRYDQSWLCVLAHLTQISRRHMVVARFKHPINMGENAHEIRLLMLILAPSQEKSTKNALETGRTFGTILTNNKFRQRLVEARSEVEFKSLMLIRAQQLSQMKSIKNRHKYRLDPAVHQSVYSSLSAERTKNRLTKQQQQASNMSSPDNKLANFRPIAKFTASEGEQNESDSYVLFNKNPRASKLFELISQSSEVFPQPEHTTLEGQESKQTISSSSCCGLGGLCSHIEIGTGLCGDVSRRFRFYFSDFKDAFVGPPKTLQKTIATTWFLYFGILLPTIAFSSLNTTQTHGYMGDLRKAILGQAIGGLCFALLGGQPLVIIMTTAPLCLYTKVIHQMCLDHDFSFPAMYAAVGLWNGFFLIIYSLFGFSKLMKWCTRSTEEIFALFIVCAFILDASKDLLQNFNKFYYTPACQAVTGDPLDLNSNSSIGQFLVQNITESSINGNAQVCRRETSLLFLILMLGTPNQEWNFHLAYISVWLALMLYKFNKTPFLESSKRELLADYALPTAVIVMSFVGSAVFSDIHVEKFPPIKELQFKIAPIETLPVSGILTAMGLGFTLSLLFFMDQNISAAMVNAPQNRLKKGCAYHLDLLVIAILNGFLTLYGLPMMHGVLPHSPLHVRSLADIEERVEEGHLREVIANVRETRVTGVISHVLVLGTLYLIPYPIAYIPRAVLNGLFLYMAFTSLDGLQIFERILLLFTEQTKYPPNHYIRRCPQGKIHEFTALQILQLLVMCLFGFSSYNIVQMFFPVIILLMIPFRHKIVPKYIDHKYLDSLDGKH